MREAHRVAGHVVQAIMRGNNRLAADLIKSFDDPQNLAIVLASGFAAVLGDRENPDGFIDGYFWGQEDASPIRTRTERARDLLRQELADGKRHSYLKIRALALSQGIRTKDLANAAQQLGVLSGDVNAAGHWYRLPKTKARA
ncbi:hypothetical protein Pve01_72490 [Planomonospora venezuelensis]|nr:hypothetical protein Pve01_72490 [Planomonospora venezuelensis]